MSRRKDDLCTRNVKLTVKMVHLEDKDSAFRAKCTDEWNVYLIRETPDEKIAGMHWMRHLVTWSFATYDEARAHYDVLVGKA